MKGLQSAESPNEAIITNENLALKAYLKNPIVSHFFLSDNYSSIV